MNPNPDFSTTQDNHCSLEINTEIWYFKYLILVVKDWILFDKQLNELFGMKNFSLLTRSCISGWLFRAACFVKRSWPRFLFLSCILIFERLSLGALLSVYVGLQFLKIWEIYKKIKNIAIMPEDGYFFQLGMQVFRFTCINYSSTFLRPNNGGLFEFEAYKKRPMFHPRLYYEIQVSCWEKI